MTSELRGVVAKTTAVQAGGSHAGSLKARAAEEFRSFLILFLYLWLLFGVFVLNQGTVQREQGVNFAIAGTRAHQRPGLRQGDDGVRDVRPRRLAAPSSAHLPDPLRDFPFDGVVHRRAYSREGDRGAYPREDGQGEPAEHRRRGVAGLLSASVIMFVALLPFFGLRNLSLAMGQGRLRAMLLGGRPISDVVVDRAAGATKD